MNLTDDQKQTVRQWLAEGLSVADVQTKLAKELEVSMTYMEVRFLLDDLKLAPQDPEEAQSEEDSAAPDTADGSSNDLPAEEAELVSGGGVSVSVDEIVRPGCLASGKATFSDGKTATWYFDQFQQFGLVPPEEGYQPPPEDMPDFQRKLQAALSRLGM